ncbi:MAG: DNA (cytosine-5-)-methyltransferase [Rickettsiales bacterium]|nr:DNA (cytosine-5-)-methyltransferase [Rickettsiales bacterium]
MSSKKLLSLFSGCGGMDLGFEGNFSTFKVSVNTDLHNDWIEKDLGNKVILKNTFFTSVFANDINKYARLAWINYFSNFNYNEEIYHHDSIVNIINSFYDNKFKFPENVDILTGGFPCQDFSLAGKRKGFLSAKSHDGTKLVGNNYLESRGNLYLWMIKAIEIVKPKIFIAENVKGLVSLDQVKEKIVNDFRSINNNSYLIINPKILSAYEYGVPQMRKRIFFIGFLKSSLTNNALKELSKNNINHEFNPYPLKTHYLNYTPNLLPNNENHKKLRKAVTCHDIFSDLDEPDSTSDESQRHFSKAKYLRNSSQGQTEIKMDRPGPTIRSEHHGNIEYRRLSSEHGGQNLAELKRHLPERRLTVRECARIQTFPDEYQFVLKSKDNGIPPSEAYKVIGNAVPPLLAYNIAKNLESKWSLLFKD